MSDHWEEVTWDREMLNKANISPTWYLDGRVAMLVNPSADHTRRYSNSRLTFLIPMHGGIWTMCVSLTGEYNNLYYSHIIKINYLSCRH